MGHGADLLTIDITGDHMSYAITARALRGSTRAAVPAPFPRPSFPCPAQTQSECAADKPHSISIKSYAMQKA